jgi:hypothetical protein
LISGASLTLRIATCSHDGAEYDLDEVRELIAYRW